MTTLDHAVRLRPTADALTDLVAVAPGVVPFGVVLGVTATAYGQALAAVLGAAPVYAGSAQLAALTVLHLGGGVVAALASGVVVNARLLLYGAALAPWFAGQPRWFRWVAPHFVLDQTYLSTVARPGYQEDRALFRAYWWRLGWSLATVWTAAVALGVLVAPLLPDLPHLALVGTAMFVAMLAARVVDRPSIVAAVVGGGVGYAVDQVAPQVSIAAGALAGIVAAALAARAGEGR